jgi:phosphoglycolate phosphatase
MTKAIIFDFDGTIADSFEVFARALEKILKRKQTLSDGEIANLRNSSFQEVIKKLDVKKWQLPVLVIKGRKEMGKHMDSVNVFDGIPEALKELFEQGYKLYIVSSNDGRSIANFLDKNQLGAYITRTQANIGLFGKVKTLNRLRKAEGFSADECIYVGDETRDIEAAAKAHMKCIAVGWGFSNPNKLRSYKPSIVVNNPKDLARSLNLS